MQDVCAVLYTRQQMVKLDTPLNAIWRGSALTSCLEVC